MPKVRCAAPAYREKPGTRKSRMASWGSCNGCDDMVSDHSDDEREVGSTRVCVVVVIRDWLAVDGSSMVLLGLELACGESDG